VVLNEVPPNCTVVGVPGRIVKQDNIKIPRSDMDQIHLPDPIYCDLMELKKENEELRGCIEKIQKCLKKTDVDIQ
ncbi:serine acetyltransferase, partial [Lachnotalea glycerini]